MARMLMAWQSSLPSPSSSASPLPCPTPPPPPFVSPHREHCNSSSSGHSADITRSCFSRSLLALVGTLYLQGDFASPEPAMAFSIGISGPKEWLKGQKKKTAAYLLAPVNVSREKLKSASSLADSLTSVDLQKAQNLVKAAARDCIKPEEGSLVALQAKTGVEVCTFRLILKNAASLVDETDPIKLSANEALDDLVSSFTSLDSVLSTFITDNSPDREVMEDAFGRATYALDNFERGVRECLGIL